MTHGEKMALLGKINMLYEMAIEISNKINKLNRQLKEAEQNDGCSKTSNNRS
jgi:predicted ATP-grasp superfamily ATP-dependent carboligase